MAAGHWDGEVSKLAEKQAGQLQAVLTGLSQPALGPEASAGQKRQLEGRPRQPAGKKQMVRCMAGCVFAEGC